MKSKRQRKIIEIIENNDIDTQEELANKLVEAGFSVTQATVSRDIRELNLIKVSGKTKKQKYAVSDSNLKMINGKYMRVLSDGILSIETAGNILVIKTVSGMAMAVGAAVDAINLKDIVGCIAGDDTIMCAIKNAENSQAVKEYIEDLIG